MDSRIYYTFTVLHICFYRVMHNDRIYLSEKLCLCPVTIRHNLITVGVLWKCWWNNKKTIEKTFAVQIRLYVTIKLPLAHTIQMILCSLPPTLLKLDFVERHEMVLACQIVKCMAPTCRPMYYNNMLWTVFTGSVSICPVKKFQHLKFFCACTAGYWEVNTRRWNPKIPPGSLICDH